MNTYASLALAAFCLAAPCIASADTIANAHHFRRVGNTVYFTASVPGSGHELYAVDAGQQSAARLIDLAPGEASSHAAAVALLGSRLLVESFTQEEGSVLWSIDPARGARTRLANLPYPLPSDAPTTQPLTTIGSRALFEVASNGIAAVWSSDGTAAGTTAVLTETQASCALPGRVLAVRRSGARHAVWSSDGTAAGTIQAFVTAADTSGTWVSRSGSHCYYAFARGSGWEIWRSDGTPNGSNVLAQTTAGSPRGFAAVGSLAYLLDTSAASTRLWRSNAVQPVFVHEGPLERDAPIHVIGSRIAYNAPYLLQSFPEVGLFVSDGTAAGTRRVGSGFGGVSETYCAQVVGAQVVAADITTSWNVDPAAATWAPSPMPTDVTCSGAAVDGVVVGSIPGYVGVAWRSNATAAGTYALTDSTDRLFVSTFEP